MSGQSLLLGSQTVPGLIAIWPHQAASIQELQQLMLQGLNEESVSLSLSGNLQNMGQGILSGEYSGILDGTQVKARCLGTSSPYGGGAIILAVTTPDKYGEQQQSAAMAIANSMRYFKPQVSDVMNHFVGCWTTTTTNTQTWMTLRPDGTFSDQYESSYSGNFSNQYGDDLGNWGAHNQQNAAGRWTVNGTREQGTITLIYQNGEQTVVQYRVNTEKGQTYYNEYYFNSVFYYREK
jgi:hypothetical protein